MQIETAIIQDRWGRIAFPPPPLMVWWGGDPGLWSTKPNPTGYKLLITELLAEYNWPNICLWTRQIFHQQGRGKTGPVVMAHRFILIVVSLPLFVCLFVCYFVLLVVEVYFHLLLADGADTFSMK